MFTANGQQAAAARKQDWLPAIISLSAIVPAVAVIMLRGRPKEVSVAFFSAYGALLMALVAAVCQKRGKRTAGAVSLAAGVLFTALFVTYAYFAWRR